ncbi:hypothetical protein UCDDS831_g08608 [Diplodia seriata]|uniref:Uncharacterized protein n=1 Tax=Diplodia seriata TaxID=420778 RepID=A0A0G2FPS3_9PEZI|nr:hypothetical protein UCDDS831_g08608 [Diplodia seriata]
MSCQYPANVSPLLARETNVGDQNGKPQDQQAGVRAYFCCACGFGPMICALYSACIWCQHELDSNCDIDIIAGDTGGTKPQGHRHAEPVTPQGARQTVNPSDSDQAAEPHRQQLPESTERPTSHPGIIQGDGMVTIAGQSNDGYTLNRYINDPPGVTERLANGLASDGSLLLDSEYRGACQKLGCGPDDAEATDLANLDGELAETMALFRTPQEEEPTSQGYPDAEESETRKLHGFATRLQVTMALFEKVQQHHQPIEADLQAVEAKISEAQDYIMTRIEDQIDILVRERRNMRDDVFLKEIEIESDLYYLRSLLEYFEDALQY